MIWRSILYDWAQGGMLLTLAFILVWGFIYLYKYRRNKLEAFASMEVLEAIVVERRVLSYVIKAVLFVLIWVCGVIVLMQPKGNGRYANESMGEELRRGKGRMVPHEVMLLIDASASMGVGDAFGKRVRLDYAKDVADNIVSGLRGETVSVYAFTSSLIQLVPATTDYIFIRMMLRQLVINEAETVGTNLARAFIDLADIVKGQPVDKLKSVILLTDGGDTLYEVKNGDEKRMRLEEILGPLEILPKVHAKTFIGGIGSKIGGDVSGVNYEGKTVRSILEAGLLQKISVIGQGSYFSSEDMTPYQLAKTLSGEIAEHARSSLRTSEGYYEEAVQEHLRMTYDEYFQIPLGLAIFALVLILTIPDTWVLRRDRA